jgi:hypothetical protein
LLLTVGGPLAFLVKYTEWLPGVEWSRMPSEIKVYIFVSFAFDGMITIVGLVAGTLLWRRLAVGTSFCKMYLIVRPVLKLAFFLFEKVYLIPSKPSFYPVFDACVASIIWYAYLEKSERVRNTFEKDYYEWRNGGWPR